MTRLDLARRRFLALTGHGALVLTAWPVLQSLAGCAGGTDETTATTLTLPLAGLPEGVRVRQTLAGVPLEIRRTKDQVVARSLLCSHQGCEVQWQGEHGRYYCPCHDGTFDADGGILGGPPTKPLRTYPVRIEDQMVIIGP